MTEEEKPIISEEARRTLVTVLKGIREMQEDPHQHIAWPYFHHPYAFGCGLRGERSEDKPKFLDKISEAEKAGYIDTNSVATGGGKMTVGYRIHQDRLAEIEELLQELK